MEPISRHLNPVGILQKQSPSILSQQVVFNNPVASLPFLAGRTLIADDGNPGSVVANARVFASYGVAGRTKHEDDACMAAGG